MGDGSAVLPAAGLASGTRCCQCSRTGTVLWSMLALVAALLLIPDWRAELHVESNPGTLCNNSLDLGGLAGAHRELGNTCEELITKGKYSCEYDFCTDGSCTLGGLCDLACRTKPNCDKIKPPELGTCLHHALGRVEGMVILVYIFAWVNLMFPALLPLARCTTALASAALIVTVRKLGHEVVPHFLQDGEEVWFENDGSSGRCIDGHAMVKDGSTIRDKVKLCWTAEDIPKCDVGGDCPSGQMCLTLCERSGAKPSDNPDCKNAAAPQSCA
eukprot:COSAG06_NODE_2794_length_6274_cov_2.952551_5_plen_272_part_00